MSDKALHLDDGSLRIVQSILQRHLTGRPVFAFGSRVRGNSRRRSDLDLAVGGSEPISLSLFTEMKTDFSESDLPIFVDVLDLNAVDEGFLKRIQQDFVAIQLGEQRS